MVKLIYSPIASGRHVDGAPDNCAVSSQRYPRYRVLTGPDDDAFCYRVSEALDLGYALHGGSAITTRGETAYVAQAVVWTTDEPRRHDRRSRVDASARRDG